MKKYFLSFIYCSVISIAFAQEYPQNYFRYPLDVKQILSGSFAELRGFHFHSGIDIKTQQREGLKIYAIADGYVSRINISPSGYGNALYVTHPNGYTSVYAHLQQFKGKIASYATAQQKSQESFSINVFPPQDALPVKKGEVIALSGNSGSSGGPHLHFEIRDTKTEETINPFLFGLTTPDHKAPLLNGMYVYAIDGDVAGKKRYDLTGAKVYKSPIYAAGKVGIGVKAYDKLDYANNMNGIYSIKMWVNNVEYFKYEVDKFSFSQTRMINSQTDYAHYMTNKSFIYKLFQEEGNLLSMVKKAENRGYIDVEPGKSYQIKIQLKDFAGNTTEGSFVVKGKENNHATSIAKNGKLLKWDEENYFENEYLSLYFPKESFYHDLYLEVNKKGEYYYIQNDRVPLHKFYTLAIEPSGISATQINHAVIAVTYNYGGRNVVDYFPTEYKDGKLIAEVRDFGKFNITVDLDKPVINSVNVRNQATFGKRTELKFKVKDSKTGIAAYDAYVNDQWVILRYDKKTNTMWINREDIGSTGSANLKIIVRDLAGNIAQQSYTINLK